MDNKITKNLIIFGAIIFSLTMVNNVSAACKTYAFSNECIVNQNYSQNNYYPPTGYYEQTVYGYNSYNSNNNNNSNNIYNPITQNTQPVPAVVNNYYYPQVAQRTIVTPEPKVVTVTAPKTFIPATTVKDTTTNNTTSVNGYNPNSYNGSIPATGGGLTALSVRGSGSFMPSSIWQWIFVIILILVIIIISRMFINKPIVGQESHIQHSH